MYHHHFPNSYSFSKCLAEQLVVEQIQAGLPCVVCRPSVGKKNQIICSTVFFFLLLFNFFNFLITVIPTWKEPLIGWTDNINGPTGFLIAGAKGILRTMYCSVDNNADFIPVDVVVNGMLLLVWNYLGNKYVKITVT